MISGIQQVHAYEKKNGPLDGPRPCLSTGLHCFCAAFTILMLSAFENVWFSQKKDHSEILIFKVLN